jgi:hypothetical protein
MNYEMAEFKYISYLRDNGWGGELTYPDETSSKKQEDGTWVLFTSAGVRLGSVSKNKTVRI